MYTVKAQEAKALAALRGLPQDRVGTWRKIALLIPHRGLQTEIKRHVALLKIQQRQALLLRRLAAPSAGYTARYRHRVLRGLTAAGKPAPKQPLLGKCGRPLPHKPDAACRKRAWILYELRCQWGHLTPEQRKHYMRFAQTGRRLYYEKQWLAKIDPRIVQTLGRREALRQYVIRHNATCRPSWRLKNYFDEEPKVPLEDYTPRA